MLIPSISWARGSKRQSEPYIVARETRSLGKPRRSDKPCARHGCLEPPSCYSRTPRSRRLRGGRGGM